MDRLSHGSESCKGSRELLTLCSDPQSCWRESLDHTLKAFEARSELNLSKAATLAQLKGMVDFLLTLPFSPTEGTFPFLGIRLTYFCLFCPFIPMFWYKV